MLGTYLGIAVLPATRGGLRQNSVQFTVKMTTPVKTGIFREILLGVFFECFINVCKSELIQSCRHRMTLKEEFHSQNS